MQESKKIPAEMIDDMKLPFEKMGRNDASWTELFGKDYSVANISTMENDVEKYLLDNSVPKALASTRIMKLVMLPSVEIKMRRCYEVYKGIMQKRVGDYYEFSDQYAVMRITWNAIKDIVRIPKNESGIQPNVIHKFKFVEFLRIKKIFEYFEEAQIPAWSLEMALEQISGNDGTTYHLSFGDDYWHSVTYSWWTELPEQWTNLDKATHSAMGYIDQLLDNNKND